MNRTARTLLLSGLLATSVLAMAFPAGAQTVEPPAFVVGPNKSYCHAAEDSLTVWMNLLVADGGEVPYQPYGEPTVPAGQNPAMDPVADESFEARMPLTPVLDQTVTIAGTVNVLAYIGSGAYGGGAASIGTSLVVDGTEIGAAAAKDHTMTPKNSNVEPGATYDEITWTFDVAEVVVPAGAVLEWVISGTVVAGNNIYLACHEARGRSYVEIPVTSASEAGVTGGTGGGNSTGNTTSSSSSTSTSPTSSSTSTTSRSTTTSSSSSSTSRSSTTNATSDKEETPAPPLAFAGLAIVAAALVMRRRLR